MEYFCEIFSILFCLIINFLVTLVLHYNKMCYHVKVAYRPLIRFIMKWFAHKDGKHTLIKLIKLFSPIKTSLVFKSNWITWFFLNSKVLNQEKLQRWFLCLRILTYTKSGFWIIFYTMQLISATCISILFFINIASKSLLQYTTRNI